MRRNIPARIQQDGDLASSESNIGNVLRVARVRDRGGVLTVCARGEDTSSALANVYIEAEGVRMMREEDEKRKDRKRRPHPVC